MVDWRPPPPPPDTGSSYCQSCVIFGELLYHTSAIIAHLGEREGEICIKDAIVERWQMERLPRAGASKLSTVSTSCGVS